jgi:hypothetical protein
MSVTLPPSDSDYAQILNSYFEAQSETYKSGLWQQFLDQEGVQATASDFLEYVQNVYQNSGTENLSPAEIAKRHVMFTVFNIIITLMKNTQDSITGESQVSIFNAAMQEQYSTAISRVPIYIGGDEGTMAVTKAADGSVSDITFGYDNISVSDIAAYIASAPANTSFQIGSPSVPDGNTQGWQDSLVFTVNNSTGITITANATPTAAPYPLTTPAPVTKTVASVGVPSDPTDAASWKSAILNLLTPYLSTYTITAATSTTPAVTEASLLFTKDVNGNPIHLAADYPYSAATLSVNAPLNIYWQFYQTPNMNNTGLSADQLQQVTSDRSARNSRSQQYIASIQAKYQVVSDTISSDQSAIQTMVNSRKGFASIITSSIGQLNTILNGIFPAS